MPLSIRFPIGYTLTPVVSRTERTWCTGETLRLGQLEPPVTWSGAGWKGDGRETEARGVNPASPGGVDRAFPRG